MDSSKPLPSTWVLSAPEGFLTPFISEALAGIGRPMSPDYFANAAPDEIVSRVVGVAVGAEGVDALRPLFGRMNRLIVIAGGSEKVEVPHNVETVIVETGWIIGTGMTGLPMRLLSAVNSGVYFHLKGVKSARVAVVHAADVAQAVAVLGMMENLPAKVTLHDGHCPTVAEVAEAFALRLKGKRIYTLKPRYVRIVAKLTGTRDLYDLTVSPVEIPEATPVEGVSMRDVIQYITNHTYGPEDI